MTRTSPGLRTIRGPQSEGSPSTAEILADLALVKAAFQLRTIEAIIMGGKR